MRASPARIPSLRRSLTSSRLRLLVEATSRRAATICPAFIVVLRLSCLPFEDQVRPTDLAARDLDLVSPREPQPHPFVLFSGPDEPEQLALQPGGPSSQRSGPLHRDLLPGEPLEVARLQQRPIHPR